MEQAVVTEQKAEVRMSKVQIGSGIVIQDQVIKIGLAAAAHRLEDVRADARRRGYISAFALIVVFDSKIHVRILVSGVVDVGCRVVVSALSFAFSFWFKFSSPPLRGQP